MTAILTALLCNVVLVLALGAWALVASWGSPASSGGGEDWTGVIFVIVLVVGGTALMIGGGTGAAVTAFLVGRRLRRAAASGQPGITTRTAVMLGSAGAGIGWLVGGAVLVGLPAAFTIASTLMN